MGRFINADSYASTGQGILSNNMFAYCNNNPMSYVDPSGEIAFTTFALVVVLVGSVTGGIFGAVSAMTTGGNVVEGAVEGVITGAIGSACGLLIPNPVLAVGAAAALSTIADISVQHTVQMIDENPISTDVGRALKAGFQTGLSTAIPQFGAPMRVAEEAFATALIWAEGAALITALDIAITKLIEQFDQDTDDLTAYAIRIWY